MMPDAYAELFAQPRSLTEELFGRPSHLKVFVSSKMAGGVYVVERQDCARAVESTGIAKAWYWERDAHAGPYCSEAVCLGNAATSDGLILILGDQLTTMTRQEFEIARARGVVAFVFIDQRQVQDEDAKAFVQSVQRNSVTKGFANLAELETHVIHALRRFAVDSWRNTSHARSERGSE